MPGVFTIEWTAAWRRRRALLLSVCVPLGLVCLLAFGGAPPRHAAVVYTVLFTLFGLFGSAIPWIRDADSGLLSRIFWTGLDPRRILGARTAAGTLVDLLELTPSAAAVVLAGAPDPEIGAHLLIHLAVALLAANLIGFWIATIARSIAEAALLCAATGLLLLHVAGVFRPPPADGPWSALAQLSPFHGLHAALAAAAGASTGPMPNSGIAVTVTAALLGVSLAASRPLLRHLTTPAAA